MTKAKKDESTKAHKEEKRICTKFGFTDGMLKVALARGRKK
tara:strand:- start:470 stop:592 length:123 start_codon:yes stop_codon:yes gene_type:complete